MRAEGFCPAIGTWSARQPLRHRGTTAQTVPSIAGRLIRVRSGQTSDSRDRREMTARTGLRDRRMM